MPLNWIKKWFVTDDVPDLIPPRNPETSAASNDDHNRLLAKLRDEYVGLLDQAFSAAIFSDPTDMPEELSDQDEKLIREVGRYVSNHLVKLDYLPRRPNSLPMVMKLLRLDKLAYSDISEALIQDPALTTQVLKTANSPLFRAVENKVETLEQAILFLGTNGIKAVMAAAVMKPVFSIASEQGSLNDEIWHWALASAQVLEELSRKRGGEAGALYLLGLLPALSLLLTNTLLEQYEKRKGLVIKPYCRFRIFRKHVFRLSCQVRKEWGLPENFDELLVALDCDRLESTGHSILLDALNIAEFAYIDACMGTPINLQQLSSLTSTTKEENQALLSTLKLRSG